MTRIQHAAFLFATAMFADNTARTNGLMFGPV